MKRKKNFRKNCGIQKLKVELSVHSVGLCSSIEGRRTTLPLCYKHSSLSLSLLHTHTHTHTHTFTKDTWATCKHYLRFVVYKCEFRIIEIILGMYVCTYKKAILFLALFFSINVYFFFSKRSFTIRLFSTVLWHDMLCRDIELT